MSRLGVRAGVFVVLAGMVAAAGCNDSRQQKTYPVTGKVTLDGTPYKGAFVALIPKDATKFVMNERPQGTTDEAGNFVLFTYSTGDGAPAGEYWVGIDSPGVPDDDGSDQSRRTMGPPIPGRYTNPQKSGIEVSIRPGTNSLPPFELTSKK